MGKAHFAEHRNFNDFKAPKPSVRPAGVTRVVPKALYRYQAVVDMAHPERAWVSPPKTAGRHILYFGRDTTGVVVSLSTKDRKYARSQKVTMPHRVCSSSPPGRHPQSSPMPTARAPPPQTTPTEPW